MQEYGESPEPSLWPRPVGWLGVILVAGYVTWYFSLPLYNAPQRVPRWQVALAFAQPGPNHLPSLLANNLPKADVAQERLSFLMPTFGLLLSLVGTGTAVLYGLRIVVPGPVIMTLPIGAGVVSLIVLAAGLAGLLQAVALWTVLFGVTIALHFLAALANSWWPRSPDLESKPIIRPGIDWFFASATLFFVILALLPTFLPTPDFDAQAYHLLGPREWFEQRRLTPLRHNVYTFFPFLTEMMVLAGMTLTEKAAEGAVVGQILLGILTLAGAYGVGQLARDWGGEQAFWPAVLLYVSTPWVYRLASIPYVEGTLLTLAVTAWWLASAQRLTLAPSWATAGLAGFLAGSAFACKYPGLISVIIPTGIYLLIGSPGRVRITRWIAYAAGCALAAGPWLARNWVWIGNPVFPLGFRWFGGTDWNSELDDRFVAAHQPSDFSVQSLLDQLIDIGGRSDWQSGLLIPFAILGLFLVHGVPRLTITCHLAYLVITYWALTHRLDRFWLTLLPFLAALAGVGWAGMSKLIGRWTLLPLVGPVLLFHVGMMVSGLSGFQRYGLKFGEATDVVRPTSVSYLDMVNKRLKADERVLVLGEGALFHSQRVPVYSTVFNLNRWDAVLATVTQQTNPMPTDELAKAVGAELKRTGIRFILVDWGWVARYREPGNYGYTPSITPTTWAAWQDLGLFKTWLPSAGIPTVTIDGQSIPVITIHERTMP